jgi:hypothetical protein
MSRFDLQRQCELGQQQLMRMDYLGAQATLSAAEEEAWDNKDFDTLARLLLPLQESRRQRRQRCGEGIVCLDLLATDANDKLDPEQIVNSIPDGQLLVAGWETIVPALEVRRLAAKRGLFLDTFLAQTRMVDGGRSVEILPLAGETNISSSITLDANKLPTGRQRGTADTFGFVMDLWERLHTPLLAAANSKTEALPKMAAYRKVIEVDYACELAHQHMASLARELSRKQTPNC